MLAPVVAAIAKSKPPTTAVPAAAECTYDANGQQSAFRWLAPARLAKDSTPDDGTHADE
ncbi:hypothetical protein [Paraburkholderia terrae]